MRVVLSAWALAIVFVGVCYGVWGRAIDVHAEGGPAESMQIVAWASAAMVALLALTRGKSLRDFFASAWLAVVAGLAAARELDLHQVIQSGWGWLPPVHFRLDWLTNPEVLIWSKILWVGVLSFIGALVLVPPLIMKAPIGKFLRVGDAPTWLLFITLALLGAGYLSDDVLGRGRLGVHPEATQGIEEVFELFGAIAFLLAAWYELGRPLSVRAAALTTTVVVAETLTIREPSSKRARRRGAEEASRIAK